MTFWGACLLTLIVIAFIAFMYSEAKRMRSETDERINYMKTQRECFISIESSLRRISFNFDNAMKEINDIND